MQVTQDVFIQKKLLYKFDKKIQTLFQSLFYLSANKDKEANKMVDQVEQNLNKNKFLSKQAVLQQIEQLKFQNFKYRTALISAKKDQTSNQEIIKTAEQQILESKRQVESLSRDLEYALKSKKNKEDFNQLVSSLKSTFEPISVQNQKLQQITRQIQQKEQRYEKELLEYEKKQKCLKLALSALKCVIQSQDFEGNLQNPVTTGNSNSLYQKQPIPIVPQVKQSSTGLINTVYSNGTIKVPTNYSAIEQGEQSQGGQIVY